MNKTINWSGLLIPIVTILGVVIQQQMHAVKDPNTLMILGALATLANYFIHPTVSTDNATPTNPPSGGALVIALVVLTGTTLVRPASAQTAVMPSSGYGAAAFVQRKATYAVGIVQVYNQFHEGRLSLDAKALLGANVTNPSAAFGCAEIVSYDLGKGWSAFGGIGVAVPFAQLKPSSINSNSGGLIVGFSGPIDLSFLGLK